MAPNKGVIRETDADAVRLAKTLLRSARFGALAVLEPESGRPLASRVAVATDLDGTPLILVSALAAHTGALLADPRCSLLLGEPGKGDPLAHPRMTLACNAVRLDVGTDSHARARRRYLNRQPKAKLYADFGDFSFFRLEPEGASLNGGFGKAYELEPADLLATGAVTDDLAPREQNALDHMNEDHADAVAIYATRLAGAPDGTWRLTGIDADGIDVADGDDVRRVFFPEPLGSAGEMREALIALVRTGRAAAT